MKPHFLTQLSSAANGWNSVAIVKNQRLIDAFP